MTNLDSHIGVSFASPILGYCVDYIWVGVMIEQSWKTGVRSAESENQKVESC